MNSLAFLFQQEYPEAISKLSFRFYWLRQHTREKIKLDFRLEKKKRKHIL